MNYAYFPGCSLGSSAKEYDASMRQVLARLDCGVTEIPDWTCCGASAAEAVSELLSLALPARTLALAHRELPGREVLVPCSACYLNLLRVVRSCEADPLLLDRINEVLAVEEVTMPQGLQVRHLIEVLQAVGVERIAQEVRRPLEGVRIAPYYGCQILRPYKAFDDPEHPASMKPLLEALGATVVDWTHAGKCCGASLMATKKHVALPAVHNILMAAADADAIVTVCPLCQMNLEAYQGAALRGEHVAEVNVLYLTQLMGLAFGFGPKELRLGGNMATAATFVDAIITGAEAHEQAAP